MERRSPDIWRLLHPSFYNVTSLNKAPLKSFKSLNVISGDRKIVPCKIAPRKIVPQQFLPLIWG